METLPTPVEILRGHTTPETAYVVDDYPYGFTLRCKIRYWLEDKKGRYRLCSQTTNPKAGNGWTNKPKASTYSYPLGLAVMYKDSIGHIHWDHVDMVSWPEHLATFKNRFAALLNEEETARLVKLEKNLRNYSPASWATWDAQQAAKGGAQ